MTVAGLLIVFGVAFVVVFYALMDRILNDYEKDREDRGQ